MRSYREQGTVKKEVLVHLGQYPTIEEALAQWPEEIQEHLQRGREEQAEKIQRKLDRLQQLHAQEGK